MALPPHLSASLARRKHRYLSESLASQNKAQLEAVQAKAQKIADMDLEPRLRPELTSVGLNLLGHAPTLERWKDFAFEVAQCDLLDIPTVAQQRVVALINEIDEVLELPESVSPQEISRGTAFMHQRSQAIAERIQDVNARLEQQQLPLLAIMEAAHAASMVPEDAAATAALIEEQAIAATEAAEEIQRLLPAARRATEQLGIAQFAIHFKQQADVHITGAKTWLITTAALGGTTLLLALAILGLAVFRPPEGSGPEMAHLIVAKLLVFSILLSATVWAGRLYRSNQHNAVVNRHRQNALSSFEAFAKVAGDPETKNAVLLQATSAIFAPQPTAFGEAGGDPAVGPTQFIEMVRTIQGGRSPG